jgi:gliding motility-associated-like protein
MKKNIIKLINRGLLSSTAIMISCTWAISQVQIDSDEYQKLKTEGRLDQFQVVPGDFTPQLNETPITRGASRSSACGCYTPPDASYTLSMTPNDDGSTSLIPIPFTFCLYGDTYNGLFINNNGNVSFVSSFGTFSATGFPSGTYRMVAPFWGDVDTRGVGQVWHKVTPTAIYINWVNVGYFNSQTDKTNTFQLILTNGNDPVIGVGNNVAFCYGDMQWTTGSASSGVNGFGGVPATVGANRGNATDFVQFGRFDQPGTAYDGPFGNSDGVDWLDYKSIIFDACVAGSNIAPVPSLDYTVNGIPAGTGTGGCDTLRLCVGDTLLVTGQFLSPESGQITSITLDTTGVPNVTINANNPGNTASLNFIFVPDASNVGVNVIVINAIDNGTPAMGTAVGLAIVVDTLNVPPPTIVGDTAFCTGGSVVLESGANYDFYVWNTGLVDSVITITAPGSYSVTGFLNGCSKQSEPFVVIEHPNPVPIITGPTHHCVGVTDSVWTDTFYVDWNWSAGSVDPVQIITAAGTYSVTVTDTNGCVGTGSITVQNYTFSVPATAFQCGTNHQVSGVNSAGGTWSVPTALNSVVSYSPNTTTVNPAVTVTTEGIMPLIFYDNICQRADTLYLTVMYAPTVSLSDTADCIGTTIVLNAITGGSATYAFNWSTGDTTNSISVNTDDLYEVTITNACGTDQATANVLFYPCALIIPNVFTPNGDGFNNFFHIQNLEYWQNSKLTILNRWGNIVYSSDNYINNWDGKTNGGKDLSDGTYFYFLQTERNGEPHEFQGTVNIFH